MPAMRAFAAQANRCLSAKLQEVWEENSQDMLTSCVYGDTVSIVSIQHAERVHVLCLIV